MEVSGANQLYVFGIMIICGAAGGAVFDLFRAVRKSFGANMLTTSLGDILFWFIISAGITAVIFSVNSGQIRWFEIIGIALGGILYFLLLSSLVMSVMGFVFKIFIKIFSTILKFVLTPIFFLYKMIKRPFCWLIKKASRFLKKSIKRASVFRGAGKKIRLILKKW